MYTIHTMNKQLDIPKRNTTIRINSYDPTKGNNSVLYNVKNMPIKVIQNKAHRKTDWKKMSKASIKSPTYV